MGGGGGGGWGVEEGAARESGGLGGGGGEEKVVGGGDALAKPTAFIDVVNLLTAENRILSGSQVSPPSPPPPNPHTHTLPHCPSLFISHNSV